LPFAAIPWQKGAKMKTKISTILNQE